MGFFYKVMTAEEKRKNETHKIVAILLLAGLLTGGVVCTLANHMKTFNIAVEESSIAKVP